jgi:hypothetical protein
MADTIFIGKLEAVEILNLMSCCFQSRLTKSLSSSSLTQTKQFWARPSGSLNNASRCNGVIDSYIIVKEKYCMLHHEI